MPECSVTRAAVLCEKRKNSGKKNPTGCSPHHTWFAKRMACWSLVLVLLILFCSINHVQARLVSIGSQKSALLTPPRVLATEGTVAVILRGGAAMKADKKGKVLWYFICTVSIIVV